MIQQRGLRGPAVVQKIIRQSENSELIVSTLDPAFEFLGPFCNLQFVGEAGELYQMVRQGFERFDIVLVNGLGQSFHLESQRQRDGSIDQNFRGRIAGP